MFVPRAQKVLASGQRLSTDHVRSIVYQLLSAARALHSAGIQHCNITPSNVMIDGDCTLTLTGFSAAQRIELCPNMLSRHTTCVNMDEAVVESMAAAAPEMFLPTSQDGPFSPSDSPLRRISFVEDEDGYGSADMWAIGCILASLLGPSIPLNLGGSPIQHLRAIHHLFGASV